MHTGYASTVCFAAAGFRGVEMNDQQIQTETVVSMEPHVKIENVTPQQCVYISVVLVNYNFN